MQDAPAAWYKFPGRTAQVPLDNCTVCGRVFNRTMRDVCPACWEAEQSLVDRVHDFLLRSPKATAADVVREIEVSEAELVRLLRRGRLVGHEQLASLMRCERCSSPVDRGTLCASCRAVVLELAGVGKEEEEEEEDPKKGPGGKPPLPRPKGL